MRSGNDRTRYQAYAGRVGSTGAVSGRVSNIVWRYVRAGGKAGAGEEKEGRSGLGNHAVGFWAGSGLQVEEMTS